jgi:putative membrane protein
MISGLRDEIISSLYNIGIDEGEIFTTDSHSVNAVILGGRGYHPVGEVINHKILMEYIKEATIAALSDLEPVKAACREITVSGIKVIGVELLETLCLLVDRTLQKAKKIVVPIFASTWLILMLILTTF